MRRRGCKGHSLRRRYGRAGAQGTYPKTRAQKHKFARVMHEYGRGDLFTPQGKRVKNVKQAVAIALSAARKV